MKLYLPFPWRQGEHLVLVGQTGTGKTTLAAALLLSRRCWICLRSKRDRTYLPGQIVRTSDSLSTPNTCRFVLDPPYEKQRLEFGKALYRVWQEGGWTVYLDELFYLTQEVKLNRPITMLFTQGRSQDITVVAGMQRPVHVTRFALSQATHVLSFYQEQRDARIVAEATTVRILPVLSSLARHEFVWYYRLENALWRGKLQDLVRL